jgi:hypothetical protein
VSVKITLALVKINIMISLFNIFWEKEFFVILWRILLWLFFGFFLGFCGFFLIPVFEEIRPSFWVFKEETDRNRPNLGEETGIFKEVYTFFPPSCSRGVQISGTVNENLRLLKTLKFETGNFTFDVWYFKNSSFLPLI